MTQKHTKKVPVLVAALAAVVVAVAGFSAHGARRPQGQAGDCRGKMVGTWRLVSATYGENESSLPKQGITLKHITPTHFTWMTYDEQTGQIKRVGGGTYTLQDKYTESARFGLGEDFDVIKGKDHAFSCRIDGSTWYHTGALANGLPISEVWELVK